MTFTLKSHSNSTSHCHPATHEIPTSVLEQRLEHIVPVEAWLEYNKTIKMRIIISFRNNKSFILMQNSMPHHKAFQLLKNIYPHLKATKNGSIFFSFFFFMGIYFNI